MSSCGSSPHSHSYFTITNSRVSRFAHDDKLRWHISNNVATARHAGLTATPERRTYSLWTIKTRKWQTHTCHDGWYPKYKSFPPCEQTIHDVSVTYEPQTATSGRYYTLKWHDMSYLLVDTYLYRSCLFQYDCYSVLKGCETFKGECVGGFRTLKLSLPSCYCWYVLIATINMLVYSLWRRVNKNISFVCFGKCWQLLTASITKIHLYTEISCPPNCIQ